MDHRIQTLGSVEYKILRQIFVILLKWGGAFIHPHKDIGPPLFMSLDSMLEGLYIVQDKYSGTPMWEHKTTYIEAFMPLGSSRVVLFLLCLMLIY